MKTFDAVANLWLGMHEYVLTYTLAAQQRARDVAAGYRLAHTKRDGWRLEFNGVTTTQGDAGRVYDVARRTPVNEHFRRGHELREMAAAQAEGSR